MPADSDTPEGNGAATRLGPYAKPMLRLTHCPGPWCGAGPAAVVTPGRVSPDVALYHDGGDTAALRLCVDGGGVSLTVGAFRGNYVSLALDLPGAMAQDLCSSHDLRMSLSLSAMGGRRLPSSGYARLVVEDSGEPWQMTVPLVIAAGPQSVVLGPGRGLRPPLPGTPRRAWVDLVLSGVAETGLRIPTLSISRRSAPVL